MNHYIVFSIFLVGFILPFSASALDTEGSLLCKNAKEILEPRNWDQVKKTRDITLANKILEDSEKFEIADTNCLFNLGSIASAIHQNSLAAKKYLSVVNQNSKDFESALLYAKSIELHCNAHKLATKKECIKDQEKTHGLSISDALRRSMLKNEKQLDVINSKNAAYFPRLIDLYVSSIASLPFYEKALMLNPTDSTLLGNYGISLFNSDKVEDAAVQFEKLESADNESFLKTPFFSTYLFSLLQIRDNRKFLDVCQKYSEKCKQDNICFHFSRALYLSNEIDQSELAIQECIERIRIAPKNFINEKTQIYDHYGKILETKGDECGALAYYQMAVTEDDNEYSAEHANDRLTKINDRNSECKNGEH